MVIVAGRSMEPTYRIGDVVVTWRDGRHGVGDPVLFRVPDSGVGPADSVARGARVIHRLVDGGPDGWVTQGDNVPHPDIWEPTDTDILGRAVLHLPGVGKAFLWLRSPLLWALFISLIVTLYLWPHPDEVEGLEGAEGLGPVHGPPTPPALRVDDSWQKTPRRRRTRSYRRHLRHDNSQPGAE